MNGLKLSIMWILFKYSRTSIIRISIIRISIIRTLGYPNTILNFEIPKRQIDFLQNQIINEMPVWFLDLLGLI